MLDFIHRPTAIISPDICRANIAAMLARCHKAGLQLRPHFKTHQSLEIGQWFREQGIETITVSSLSMAHYFAKEGWTDITVAFPVNIREKELICSLAEQIKLQLLVESIESISALEQLPLSRPSSVFIKIDVGAGRTGIEAQDTAQIDRLLEKIEQSNKLHFVGFLAHAGQSYSARGKVQIIDHQQNSLQLMQQLKNQYQRQFPHLICSLGDTPSCSMDKNWEGIDELRPGNFVFYDLMQYQIGACTLNDIGMLLAAPVVAKHPKRQEIVLYAGAIHLSKEGIFWEEEQKTIYGLATKWTENGPQIPIGFNYLRSLSQEHGILCAETDFFNSVQIGDLLAIYPVHSCLTADCMGQYQDIEGKYYTHFRGRKK